MAPVSLFSLCAVLITGMLQVPQEAPSPGPELPSRHYLARHFTVEEGLPVNSVNDIVQDERGYLYFSTLDGLVRYDGYEFTTFNSGNSPGLTSNRITGITKTSSGLLYMISEPGALTRFDGTRFRTFGPEEGVQDEVTRIREGPNGKIWIGTTRGVAYGETSSERFHPVSDSLLAVPTWVVEATSGGGVIAVNRHGLVRWEDGESAVLLDPGEIPIPFRDIVTISRYGEEAYWVMGQEGFFALEESEIRRNLSHLPGDPSLMVWDVTRTGEDRHLFTASDDFFEVDNGEGVVSTFGIPVNATLTRNNMALRGSSGEQILLGDDEVVVDGETVFHTGGIQAGLVDREGSIWITTYTSGVYQIRRSSFTNVTSAGETPIENIYPVLQASDGAVWAGSLNGGVFRLDGNRTTNWNASNSNLASGLVRYLHEDRDGTLYAGLWEGGLWTFDGRDWNRDRRFEAIYEGEVVTVEAMHRDRSGRLLIGSQHEMAVKEEGSYRLFHDSEGRTVSGVRVIRESESGALFLGTNGQGLSMLTENNRRTVYTEEDGLSSNLIRDIHLQSEDTLWIATQNLGLNRLILSPDRSVRSAVRIGTADGLIDNSLHRIIEGPRGNLWISSNSGIMRIARSELNRYAEGESETLPVVGFDESDGMVNREANGGVQNAGMLSADNRLWFPNQRGLTVIDPGQSGIDRSLPPADVALQTIALSDSLLPIGEKSVVTLPRGERNVQISFTAPNFAHPERMTLRYRLSGLHENWQVADETREATFTNLSPGTHLFEASARRLDGTSSASSVTITVPPYFYETVWFYLLLAGSVAALVYGGYRYRVAALRRREKRLQERVNEQTRELRKAAQEKSRFFTGITHELKTPLSLIAGPLNNLLEDEGADTADSRRLLQMMKRNTRRLKNLVNQILDVNRLNANALHLTLQPVPVGTVSMHVAGQFRSLLRQKRIRFEVSRPEEDPVVYLDRDAWERILINLMSNAIRFSPEGEEIVLSITESEQHVEVSVRDRGKGIREEDREQVFDYLYQAEGADAGGGTGIGLYLVRELVRRMGGSVKLKSAEGEGAEFIITLKKGHDHFSSEDRVLHEPLSVSAAGMEPELGTKEQNGLIVDEDEKLPEKETPTAAEAGPENDREDETREDNRSREGEAARKAGRIMVVEDDPDFRNYLRSKLSETYRVFSASEGGEALDNLQEFDPELVISDVMMPGMGGLEFVRSLRDAEGYKNLPVIFLSAKDRDSDIEAGLSTGADIYLTKPIRSRMLLAQVSAVLRREQILRERESGESPGATSGIISRVGEIVYRQLGNPDLTIEMLADALFMSRATLYREWNEASNMTLNEYIVHMRMEEAKVLLEEEGFSVQEAARAVGYASLSYFSTSFRKAVGHNPSELKG